MKHTARGAQCQNCGDRPATVTLTWEWDDGDVDEQDWCGTCARWASNARGQSMLRRRRILSAQGAGVETMAEGQTVEQLIADLSRRVRQADETRDAAQAEATRQTELRRVAERRRGDLVATLETVVDWMAADGYQCDADDQCVGCQVRRQLRALGQAGA